MGELIFYQSSINLSIWEELDIRLDAIDQEEEEILGREGKLTGSMVGRRRIAATWAVGEACERFSREKEEVVCHSFLYVGISFPIDGSADDQISIKEIETGYLAEGVASEITGGGDTWEEVLQAIEQEEVVGSIVRVEVEEDEYCSDSDDENIFLSSLLPKIEK